MASKPYRKKDALFIGIVDSLVMHMRGEPLSLSLLLWNHYVILLTVPLDSMASSFMRMKGVSFSWGTRGGWITKGVLICTPKNLI